MILKIRRYILQHDTYWSNARTKLQLYFLSSSVSLIVSDIFFKKKITKKVILIPCNSNVT
jgi:hypothetical protein